MSAAYEAVILAAGRGSRLGDATREYPKAMLPIGPRSLDDATETCFLRRQAELLRDAGVERITVVVGYHRKIIEEAVGGWGLGIKIAVNPTPEIRTSGSLHSFQFAVRSGLGILDGSRQTLLMDADIVYDRRVLKLLLDAPEENALLVSGGYEQGSEEVLVFGTPERPRFMAKGLTPELAGGEECLGEAVGIVKFAPEDHGLARRTLDWMLGDPESPEGSFRRAGFGPAKQATEHEELTQRFMHYGRMRAVVFGGDLPFMEVDSAEEYAFLKNQVYPRILATEAGERRSRS